MNIQRSDFLGECLGTFLLVLFGCGSVAVSVLFDAHQGLFQIALVWGIAVTLAIYATRHLSCAHLNPAVSIAMVLTGRMRASKLPVYLVAQFIGAFLAGWVIFLLFSTSIAEYEATHNIVRGTPESMKIAKMFGEYYAQPVNSASVSLPLAMFAEGFGTFLLVLIIFALTEGCNVGRPDNTIAPLFIGLTVSSIICLIAPLTQAGLNPARDFAPRMVAFFTGWGAAAWPDESGGFFLVYVLAPIVGGIIAGFFFCKIVQPALHAKSKSTSCCCDSPDK